MLRESASAGTVGLFIVLVLLLCYYGGGWLDRKLGTDPWFSYIGLLVAVLASIRELMRIVRNYKKSLDNEEPPKKPPN